MCSDFDRLAAISGWVPACYPPPWHANTNTDTHSVTCHGGPSQRHTSTVGEYLTNPSATHPNPTECALSEYALRGCAQPDDSKAQWLMVYRQCMMTFTDGKRACHFWNQTLTLLCQVSNDALTDLFGYFDPSNSILKGLVYTQTAGYYWKKKKKKI